MNKPYAVVFTYSFDDDGAVYTFKTFEEASAFMRSSFDEEIRIDMEENGWETIYEWSDRYACIKNYFWDHVDVTEMHLLNVYS